VRSTDLVERLPQGRVAVTNGGTTMLMAASLGAAVLSVAQYEHQAANARRLAAAGAAEFLGLASEVDYDALVARVAALFADPEVALRLGTAGRKQVSGLGRGALVEAAQVVARLDWDSAFFGFPIACLFPKQLSPAVLRLAESFCREQAIECLYFLADAADKVTHAAAEAAGFHCVDERWTYRATARAQPAPLGADGAIRRGRPADAAALAAIAGDAYEASRYYFDRHFPRAACQRFYSDWIQKSLRGEFDHIVLVAESDAGEVAGYISCRALSPNLGRIGLVGIAPGSRGRGLGARLVAAALGWFAERDLVRVEVVT